MLTFQPRDMDLLRRAGVIIETAVLSVGGGSVDNFLVTALGHLSRTSLFRAWFYRKVPLILLHPAHDLSSPVTPPAYWLRLQSQAVGLMHEA